MSETTEPEMLMRFIEGLKQAAGSANQLAHAQQNPQWLGIRDALEHARDMGSHIAMARAVPRQEVLSMLDRRQAKYQ